MKNILIITVILSLLVCVTSFAVPPANTYWRTNGSELVPIGGRSVRVGVTSVEVTATGSLTAAQVNGTLVTNYGMASNGDTTLPAVSSRTRFSIVTEAASQAWSLKPPSGELFILDGTALDANDEIDIGNVAGDHGILIRIRTGAATYRWCFYSIEGTHADGDGS